MDSYVRGEMAEAGIDAFIAKRDKQRRRDEGERLEEALFAESARRYTERQDEDLETVYAFREAYGELPPASYFRRLWWWLRGGEGG